DLAVNVLTISLQLFVTARVVQRFGVLVALCALPILTTLGFIFLGLFPLLLTLVIFQVVRRAGAYALARPAREMLYTVVPPADKYASKNFIDTAVYRGGDAAFAFVFDLFKGLGLGVNAMAFAAVPLALLWTAVAALLGRSH